MHPPLDIELEAAIAFLCGEKLPPRTQGRLNESRIVKWIYRWGFTSSMMIQHVIQRTAGGAAAHYVRKGLIKATETGSGIPRNFYTLTRQGLELAEYNSNTKLRYPELEPYRVNQNQLRHDLLAQSLTLEQLHAQTIDGYAAPKEIQITLPRHRRPDAIWLRGDGKHTALEVELTGKWDRSLDQFFTDAWASIEAGHYNNVHVVSTSAALLERYRKHITKGSVIPFWKKNMAGRWWPVSEILVTPYLESLFTWRHLASTADIVFGTKLTKPKARTPNAVPVPVPSPEPPTVPPVSTTAPRTDPPSRGIPLQSSGRGVGTRLS